MALPPVRRFYMTLAFGLMNTRLFKLKLGFSLFEVIVYIAIVSVVMVAVLGILAQTVLNRVKAETLHSVTHTTRYAVERLAQDVRAATEIDQTAAASDSLVVTLADGTVRTYQVIGEQFTVSTNSGTPITLTPAHLAVTAFTIDSYAADYVTVTLALAQAADNPRPEYQADFSLTTTVNTRL